MPNIGSIEAGGKFYFFWVYFYSETIEFSIEFDLHELR